MTGESEVGTPCANVQVTIVSVPETTPVPVTPSILQSTESASPSKSVPVNVKTDVEVRVIVDTVGDEASRASY